MFEVPNITVRDRRVKHQFSIHNRIIDEWLPIIGPKGYMLYSLYVRMASNDEERSFPGYRLIEAHTGIGSTAISDHNKLLMWCGLIHIEPGGNKDSNDYYILEIPEVTPDRIEKIRQQAQRSLKPKSKFLACVLDRLKDWKSIQERWGRKNHKPVIVHPAQMNLLSAEHPAPVAEHLDKIGAPVAEHPAPVAEHPAPVAEHPAPVGGAEQSKLTIQTNNPKGGGEHPPTFDKSFKEAVAIFEKYHGKIGQNLAKTETISRLVEEEGAAFDMARWKAECRTIAGKDQLKGRADLVIQNYQERKATAPADLDPVKRAAYEQLQRETKQAEEVTAQSLQQFNTANLAAAGVDVEAAIRRVALSQSLPGKLSPNGTAEPA